MMTAHQIMRIRQQLQDFVEDFAADLGRSERRHWCGKYIEGLLREGERKSIEPMAARIDGDEQALQQFVSQSPWDHEAVLHSLRQRMRPRSSRNAAWGPRLRVALPQRLPPPAPHPMAPSP